VVVESVVVESHPPAATPVVVATASLQGARVLGAAGTRSTPPSADRDADTRRDAVARRLPPPITPAVSPAPRGPVAGAASAASGSGSPAPMAVVFCAALAAMALLARTLVSAPAFARSVSLVLVVERPG
jgi:small neutral amino acid transporter SnatA (MarC family)